MKTLFICLVCALLVTSNAAFADTTPHHAKSSSFAPHPGGAKRRVYGAPIQGKILKRQSKPKAVSAPYKP